MWSAELALAGVVAYNTSGELAGASGTRSYALGHAATDSHSKAVPGVACDSHGKIARSSHFLQQIKNANPCPGTGKTCGSCLGYVADHDVVPLKRDGADIPSNMQWSTQEEAKQNNRRE